MKTFSVKNGPENVPSIILVCMRMPALTTDEAAVMIQTAMDLGINFFDNATCYDAGAAEERFGDALVKSGIPREKMIIQSKCGIFPDRGEFDWTKECIIDSVNGILRRMKTDYLDVLLLHRPDLLFEPCEVAEAFDELEKTGKVKYFGVSNVSTLQLELLRKYVKQPLVFDQLQFSLDQSQLIDQDLYVNNVTTDRGIDRYNQTLDYCRLNDITIQAWSPLQKGFFGGCFVDDPELPELNDALQEIADRYNVTKTAVAIAWILRHPARMQAIVGTMDADHLKDIAKAADITLTHHEWYELYRASGKFLP